MATWKYESVPITLHRSGEFQLQDLEEHKKALADEGWEFIAMRIEHAVADDSGCET